MMTIDARGVSDALIERVQRHYEEGEIVEIIAMAGMFNYLNRVADSLRIEPTKPGEGVE
jgi:alkylhydroperoxidase family enzyme